MEALTRIVADSLARHGLDRPVDPRRLQWSRWSRCDSPHSLLVVPSKPGIFAIAEEVLGGAALQRCDSPPPFTERASAPEGITDGGHRIDTTRRMLAVLRFYEDDDMAFTLDRMFTRANSMRDRLASGRCFLRFVVIRDETQRRSICAALNQWMLATADRVGRTLLSDSADNIPDPAKGMQPILKPDSLHPAQNPDSGANKNLHCPHPLPSGF